MRTKNLNSEDRNQYPFHTSLGLGYPTIRQTEITQLEHRLICLAYAGLGEANKGNPFWSKSDAMRSINSCRIYLM